MKDLIDRDYENYLLSLERGICNDPGKFCNFLKSGKHYIGQRSEYITSLLQEVTNRQKQNQKSS